MLEQTLSAALGQLCLADDPLSEGKPESIAFDFSPTLQTHFRQIIGFAFLHLGKIKMNATTELGVALQILNIRLGHYFKDPKALASGHALLAPIDLRKQLCQQLTAIVARIATDEPLLTKIINHDVLRQCLSALCLLQAYFTHEETVDSCLSASHFDLNTVQKKIFLARSTFKRIDSYPVQYQDPILEQQLISLKRVLLQKIYILECLYIPDTLGFKELQFHIDRKNALAKVKQTPYSAELIYHFDAYQQHAVDQVVVTKLIERMRLIKDEQLPRTQFIIDVLGVGHAMVIDVALNKHTGSLDMICVDSACLGFQADFLKQLLSGLAAQGMVNTRTVAIQTGLLKDYHSCYTLSLALSSELAKHTVDHLLADEAIPQPTFLRSHGSSAESALANVHWRDVTALGKKVVMMGQSFTEMKTNLLKMFPQDTKIVDGMIRDLKNAYGMGEKLDSLGTATHEKSYSHLKRASLRQKTTQNPYADLTTSKVLTKVNSTEIDQALRRLAAGFGPCRDMRFLVESHPDMIDKPNASGFTALYFAHKNGKLGRAFHLEKALASKTDEKQKTQRTYSHKF